MKGKFIVFEGLDGCGKDTQLELIKQRMINCDIPVTVKREPTDGLIGKTFRQFLNPESKETVTPEILSGLMALDRMNNIMGSDGVIENISKGVTVLQSRYHMSSIAYNNDGYTDEIKALLDKSLDAMHPDLTIYLSLSPEDALIRISMRGEPLDKFERKEKLEYAHMKYWNQIVKESDDYYSGIPKVHNIIVVNAMDTIENITEHIWNHVITLYGD